jgi:hypothetical protein
MRCLGRVTARLLVTFEQLENRIPQRGILAGRFVNERGAGAGFQDERLLEELLLQCPRVIG